MANDPSSSGAAGSSSSAPVIPVVSSATTGVSIPTAVRTTASTGTVSIAIGTTVVPSSNPQNVGAATTSSSLPTAETPAEKLEEAVRAKYGLNQSYFKAQTRSTIKEADLEKIREQYGIPNEYKMRVPDEEEKMFWKPENKWVAISTYALRYGIRFPLPDFITSFLSFVGIGFTQLVPNSYIHLVCFIAFCKQNQIDPAMDLLARFFSLGRSKEPGYRQLTKRPGGLVWMETPSSNKGWHPEWFYMSGGELAVIPRWGEPHPKIMDFMKSPSDRINLFNQIYENMPKDPWPIEHLSSHKWLFDNGCK